MLRHGPSSSTSVQSYDSLAENLPSPDATLPTSENRAEEPTATAGDSGLLPTFAARSSKRTANPYDISQSEDTGNAYAEGGHKGDFLPASKRYKAPSFLKGIRGLRAAEPSRARLHPPSVSRYPVDLPDDVLHNVFRNLQDQDLCNAALVCRQWRARSQHEDFWTSLTFEKRTVTLERIVALCHQHSKLEYLNVRGVTGVDDEQLHAALGQLRHLRHLVLGKQSLPERLLAELHTHCPQLRTLEFTDPTYPSGAVQDFTLSHPGLTDLNITGCRAARALFSGHQIQRLSLRRLYASPLLLDCPALTALDLSSCKLSDSLLRGAIACPTLTALNLSVCTPLTDETLREAAASCPALRELDLSFCPNIFLEGVHFTALESLKLNSCDGLTNASIQSLEYCVSLQELVLDDCSLLSSLPSVALHLPRLQSLSCCGCRCLVELVAHCPALTALCVDGCHMLSRLEVHSAEMTELCIQHLIELQAVALHCGKLQHLELSDCDKLKDNIFEVLSDAAALPALLSVCLDQCEGLHAAALASPSVGSLSLAGCKQLELLSLHCPRLAHLALDDCDHLLTANFTQVGLGGALDLGICRKLRTLHLCAPALTSLKLCGCGFLYRLTLICPRLHHLDTTFCTRLCPRCLISVPATCSSVSSLSLAYCAITAAAAAAAPAPPALEDPVRLRLLTAQAAPSAPEAVLPEARGSAGLRVVAGSGGEEEGGGEEEHEHPALQPLAPAELLPNLHLLQRLTWLDLSYTQVTDLRPVLVGCPSLVQLNLSACKRLKDASMAPLLEGACVPRLRKLDVSYCTLGTAALHAVLASASHLTSLNLSANTNVTKELFSPPEDAAPRGAPPRADLGCGGEAGAGGERRGGERGGEGPEDAGRGHALLDLKCVGCSGLEEVCINMGPPARQPRSALFDNLQHLNLRLSGVARVSIALAGLLTLDLRDCRRLAQMRLPCPALTVLHLQGCCRLAPEVIEGVLQDTPALEELDLREMPQLSASWMPAVERCCPTLRRIYTSTCTSSSEPMLSPA